MTIHIWMLDQYGHCDELLIEVCRACDIERLDAEGAMDTLAPTLEAES